MSQGAEVRRAARFFGRPCGGCDRDLPFVVIYTKGEALRGLLGILQPLSLKHSKGL